MTLSTATPRTCSTRGVRGCRYAMIATFPTRAAKDAAGGPYVQQALAMDRNQAAPNCWRPQPTRR
jgi:hypothetical protein